MTSWCQQPHLISLPPSLAWRVGCECIVRQRIQRGRGWQWLCEPRVWLRSPTWSQESFLEFSHMKLVGRLGTAAAFKRACRCLYLCLQNTKWAVARNEPLHFLTTASQTDVSAVCSQMFPSTTMLLEVVLCLIREWTRDINLDGKYLFGWRLCALQWLTVRTETHPLLPMLCPRVYSLRLPLYPCLENRFISTIFSRFRIYALIYDICLSLSDLFHSV